MILDFIAKVKAFTGAPQVDVVAHSLGVSMTMAALTWHDETSDRSAPGRLGRRAPLREHRRWHARARAPAAASGSPTRWCHVRLAEPAGPLRLRLLPGGRQQRLDRGRRASAACAPCPPRIPDVDFYTIHAGAHDEVHCGPAADAAADVQPGRAVRADAPNVRAQLDVGAGVDRRARSTWT